MGGVVGSISLKEMVTSSSFIHDPFALKKCPSSLKAYCVCVSVYLFIDIFTIVLHCDEVQIKTTNICLIYFHCSFTALRFNRLQLEMKSNIQRFSPFVSLAYILGSLPDIYTSSVHSTIKNIF